ncbi:MAG: flagellar hook-length control protein FliK [Limnochordia bacterium]|jgi:hypothetical protein|nr:flagellar hook-length control protein FliK [Limnochordia bacterium]MDD2629380.1 flagellar hook-length control protein FliK [Limnochordia bacterium]
MHLNFDIQLLEGVGKEVVPELQRFSPKTEFQLKLKAVLDLLIKGAGVEQQACPVPDLENLDEELIEEGLYACPLLGSLPVEIPLVVPEAEEQESVTAVSSVTVQEIASKTSLITPVVNADVTSPSIGRSGEVNNWLPADGDHTQEGVVNTQDKTPVPVQPAPRFAGEGILVSREGMAESELVGPEEELWPREFIEDQLVPEEGVIFEVPSRTEPVQMLQSPKIATAGVLLEPGTTDGAGDLPSLPKAEFVTAGKEPALLEQTEGEAPIANTFEEHIRPVLIQEGSLHTQGETREGKEEIIVPEVDREHRPISREDVSRVVHPEGSSVRIIKTEPAVGGSRRFDRQVVETTELTKTMDIQNSSEMRMETVEDVASLASSPGSIPWPDDQQVEPAEDTMPWSSMTEGVHLTVRHDVFPEEVSNRVSTDAPSVELVEDVQEVGVYSRPSPIDESGQILPASDGTRAELNVTNETLVDTSEQMRTGHEDVPLVEVREVVDAVVPRVLSQEVEQNADPRSDNPQVVRAQQTIGTVERMSKNETIHESSSVPKGPSPVPQEARPVLEETFRLEHYPASSKEHNPKGPGELPVQEQHSLIPNVKANRTQDPLFETQEPSPDTVVALDNSWDMATEPQTREEFPEPSSVGSIGATTTEYSKDKDQDSTREDAGTTSVELESRSQRVHTKDARGRKEGVVFERKAFAGEVPEPEEPVELVKAQSNIPDGGVKPLFSREVALESEPKSIEVKEVAERIVQEARLVSEGTDRSFHLRLSTEKAEIKVILSLVNQRITGRFVVEEATLFRTLENSLPELRTSLQRMGIEMGSMQAFLHQDWGQGRHYPDYEPAYTFSGFRLAGHKVRNMVPRKNLMGSTINVLA